MIVGMSNIKKSLLYGIAGAAVTGIGYILNEHLKKNKPKKEYQAVSTLIGDVGGTNIRLELNSIRPPQDAP